MAKAVGIPKKKHGKMRTNRYFHVPIHPKHRKFFSSHLALPLFVNNKFIELQPGGYFVCSRPDLAPLVPSAQTPSHRATFIIKS